MKIAKRILISLLIIITISSLSYGAFIAKALYEKYSNTIEWENSSLISKIHQVPPSLAKNYISKENQRILEILTEVNIALEEIKAGNEVNQAKKEDYWMLYEKAKKEIEASEEFQGLLTKGLFSDFELYLKADEAIENAYSVLEIEGLEEYEKAFASRIVKESIPIESLFLERLKAVSKDYYNLESFSKNALGKLGVIENKVLQANVKVDKKTTQNLLTEIENKELTKFKHINKLVKLLNSEKWDAVLAHNESSKEYYAWKESQAILEGLLQANYVKVSNFKTVADIKAYDSSIKLEERKHHTIKEDSVVTAVFYNREQLSNELYVKRGAPIYFTINYEYIEDPKSTITVEYFDVDGNKLLEDITYENYVGEYFNVDKKSIDGYVFVGVKNEISKFQPDNSKVQVIYDVYVEPEPEPEPDPEPEEEIEVEIEDENPEEESQDN